MREFNREIKTAGSVAELSQWLWKSLGGLLFGSRLNIYTVSRASKFLRRGWPTE